VRRVANIGFHSGWLKFRKRLGPGRPPGGFRFCCTILGMACGSGRTRE
jgi:hypothetical protein